MDSVNMAIRYLKPKSRKVLGTINLSDTTKVKYAFVIAKQMVYLILMGF
jgi:hypothetical protein